MTVGLVLVSHVAAIAQGVRELVAQMAPGVTVADAGGTDGGGMGTSFDLVLAALEQAQGGDGIVALYDLGSALLTTQTAIELLDPELQARVLVVDAPLVEGALAAAVAAQGGASLPEVADAARSVYAAAASAAAPAGDPARPEGPAHPGAGHPDAVRATVRLRNTSGLHARPAAQLVRAIAGLDADVRVGPAGAAGVDARSLIAVVALGLRGGALVELSATGFDADDAIRAACALVDTGFGETSDPDEVAADAPPRVAEGVLQGIAVSPGLATGPLVALRQAEPDVPRRRADLGSDAGTELTRLTGAVATARRSAAALPAGLAEAHLALLDDPLLLSGATAEVEGGLTADSAWWSAVANARATLAASPDDVARARAADVLDIGLQVLAALDPARGVRRLQLDGLDGLDGLAGLAGAVVAASDLLPSQVSDLAAAGVAGLATAAGARTAHASVVARGFGLPMVAGLGAGVLTAPAGGTVVLDGTAGTLEPDPALPRVRAAQARAAADATELARAVALAQPPVVLADGRRILVEANVGSVAEARAAVAAGADGVGLLRTELLFLGRPDMPGEEEQADLVHAVLEELGERRVVVRTLDVGGDKDLPALHLDPRRNGFLGERGLRHGLAHPEILRTQLRAVLRAAGRRPVGEVDVMAPMVTFADEARAFREIVGSVVAELECEGIEHRAPTRVGVMVEVPAAALAVDEIGREVDFVSVGSNDLLQCLAAAERTVPEVAHLYRPDGTALWRLLEMVVVQARSVGCDVAVCGEIAGDRELAPRLVHLGIAELSVVPGSVPAVKAALRL